MTITRSVVEQELVSRCGELMGHVGFDKTTIDGTNADLNSPIGYAVRVVGGTVTSPALVVDADVATVDAGDEDALYDVAELRLLLNIRGNLTTVDLWSGPFREAYSSIGDYLKDQIDALTKKVEEEYGLAGVNAQAGMVTNDFASHDEDPV
jgi:hypothetical protein